MCWKNNVEQSQKAAVKAQLPNDDRVFYKNKINRLLEQILMNL